MIFTIDLPPGDTAWLDAQAKLLGVEPAEVIRKLVHERALSIQPPVHKTAEERIRAMDAFAKANRKLPILPDSAFDRENLYD